MKKTIRLLVLLMAFSSLGRAATLDSGTTVFLGVNVIPMDKERVLRNQTVIVRDGVIAEIGDAKR